LENLTTAIYLFPVLVSACRLHAFQTQNWFRAWWPSEWYYVDSPAIYIVSFELIHQIASWH